MLPRPRSWSSTGKRRERLFDIIAYNLLCLRCLHHRSLPDKREFETKVIVRRPVAHASHLSPWYFYLRARLVGNLLLKFSHHFELHDYGALRLLVQKKGRLIHPGCECTELVECVEHQPQICRVILHRVDGDRGR